MRELVGRPPGEPTMRCTMAAAKRPTIAAATVATGARRAQHDHPDDLTEQQPATEVADRSAEVGRRDGERRRGQRDGAWRERRRAVEVDEPGHGDPRVAIDGGTHDGGDRDGDDDAGQRCRVRVAAAGGRRTPPAPRRPMRSGPRRAASTADRRTVGTRRAARTSAPSRSAPTLASTVATTSASTLTIARATSVGRRARASRGVDAKSTGPDARRRVAARVMLRIVRLRPRPGADRRGRSIGERGRRCHRRRGRAGGACRRRRSAGGTPPAAAVASAPSSRRCSACSPSSC